MHETHAQWTDMLSAYIDGELAPEQAQALERHLASCDGCSRTLAELRSIVDAAGSLEDTAPPTDLWAGIAAAIGAQSTRPLPEGVLPEGVLPLRRERGPARRTGRAYSFSMPQLAAAAMLLMALSAGGAWWFALRQAPPETAVGTIVHVASDGQDAARLAASGDEPATPPVQAQGGTGQDIAELELALDSMRGRIDPATAEVLERSLESIDQAIATARAALEADPGNPHLSRQLDNTMRKKLDILRRAYRVQRAGI